LFTLFSIGDQLESKLVSLVETVDNLTNGLVNTVFEPTQISPNIEGAICTIPDDLVIRILINVGDPYLFSLFPLVCKRWNNLINNDGFWKQRYLSCAPYWLQYQSHHFPKSKLHKVFRTTTAFYEKWISKEEVNNNKEIEEKPELTWKQKYFIEYSRNSPEYQKFVQSRRQLVSNQSVQIQKLNFSPAFNSTHKILIVGEGLEPQLNV